MTFSRARCPLCRREMAVRSAQKGDSLDVFPPHSPTASAAYTPADGPWCEASRQEVMWADYTVHHGPGKGPGQ